MRNPKVSTSYTQRFLSCIEKATWGQIPPPPSKIGLTVETKVQKRVFYQELLLLFIESSQITADKKYINVLFYNLNTWEI